MGLSSNQFRVLSLVAFALSGSCGGSPAGSSEPAATPHEDAASRRAEGAPRTEEEAATEEPAPDPKRCEGGTCLSCGTGLCLRGWYCDESASGGPACGWLPQCAQEPSCSCLRKVLGAGCSCSEQDGGVHVTCK